MIACDHSSDISLGSDHELNVKISDGIQIFEPTERWTTTDASELYDVARWGKGYFSVGDNGHLFVHPNKEKNRKIEALSK